MSTSGRREPLPPSRALIDSILARAKRQGAPEGMPGVNWWLIGKKSAADLVKDAYGPDRKPPRPGYEILLPESARNGHRGVWAVKNSGGKYEIQFYYR